jgi:hypothetical protein
LETIIEIYHNKSNGEGKKLAFVCKEIIHHLNKGEIDEFLKVISNELDTTTDTSTIIMVIQILPSELWGRLKKTAKLRIETKLMSSIKTGEVLLVGDKLRNVSGALGTWASRLIPFMMLKDELKKTILEKLRDRDVEDNYYVLKFFIHKLPSLFTTQPERNVCIRAMKQVVNKNETKPKELIVEFVNSCSEEWRDEIVEHFMDITDPEHPEYYTIDGRPFLGKIPETQEPDPDDIPF